mgnify:CR=1 FL=1
MHSSTSHGKDSTEAAKQPGAAYSISNCSLLACYGLLAKLWQVTSFFWTQMFKRQRSCFVSKTSGKTQSLGSSPFHPSKDTVRDKWHQVYPPTSKQLRKQHICGIYCLYLPWLNCFTASKSRSKNIRISSGSEPARNRRTMDMRVAAADLPCVLFPVLFLILP